MFHQNTASQQISVGGAVLATILAVAAIDTFGAEPAGSSTATGSSQRADSKSVSAELRKLFKKSGRQMPSLRTADLPNTTTPRLNRIRKRQDRPAVSAKKIGLFSRIFGRFRRNEHVDENIQLTPPPIILKRSPQAGGVKINRMADNRATPEDRPSRLPTVVAEQTRSVSSADEVTVRQRESLRADGPASQWKASDHTEPLVQAVTEIPTIEVMIPLEDDEFLYDGDKGVEVNAARANSGIMVKVETVSGDQAGDELGYCEKGEPSSLEPEHSPFSGLRINASDEFISPFEYSNAVTDRNELDLNFVVEGIQPFNEAETGESTAFGSVRVEESTQPRSFVRRRTVFMKPQPQVKTTKFNQWQLRSARPELSVPFKPQQSGVQKQSVTPSDRISVDGFQDESPQLPGRIQDARWEKEKIFCETVAPKSTRTTHTVSLTQTRRQKIEARRHRSGFMGFCPVELCESRELVEASAAFESRFGLNTYQFSSAAARDRFDANPARYVPAAGGADVVALVNSGEQHPGSLEFAVWYRNRLYLFHSRITMLLFHESPASFADHY